MKLFYEWGTKLLQKHGEELCGDNVDIARHADYVTLALSDGLGSGVKANILSILTTRIVMHLMENELPLSEVVETLTKTLPVCDVRKLAYSTFAIGQFFRDGRARIVEFDTPSFILLRQRKSIPVPYKERQIEGKTIREAELQIKIGDWSVFVSDGVTEAKNSAGEFFSFDRLETLLGRLPADIDAAGVMDAILAAVRAHLGDLNPQDDMTVVVTEVLPE